MYYLETACTDPHFNLAYEEFVLLHRRSGSYFILWQNEDAVIIGQNQSLESEVNLLFTEKCGIPVVRRSTGGGAVFHDMGNLNFSFITGRTSDTTSAQFTQQIIDALAELGLPAVSSGRNDIVIDGRKVSGMAERIDGNRILHHGTLLFNTDIEKMACALRPDPEKLLVKGIHSIRSRVGNIQCQLSAKLSMEEFWAHIRKSVVGSTELSYLTDEEIAAIRNLAVEKYNSFAWNHGRSQMCRISRTRRFPGGTLLVLLSVHGGCITEICFQGDFLSLRSPDDIASLLKGCRYDRMAILAVLNELSVEEYFGGITAENVASTIMGENSDDL